MTRNLKDLIKKSFVFTLAVIFTLSGLDFGWTQTPASLSPVKSFSIPDSLGKTTDSFIPVSGRQTPLLIHIEDAHAHFATQSKIREILNYLRREQGVNTVFIEGASEKIDTSLFNIFPDPKMNVNAAERWMKEGQFSGAEVFGIENGPSVNLQGVENQKLYSENLKEFQETHKLFESSESVLNEWNSRLTRLKSKIYLGDLKQLGHSADQFASEKINILEYAVVLGNLAGKHQINTQIFPHLIKLFALENSAKSVSPDEWQKEWLSVKDFIANQIPASDSAKQMLSENWEALKNSDLVVHDKNLLLAKEPRFFFEILITAGERYGFSFKTLKELPKVAGFLISQKEITGPEIFSEIADLETQIAEKLVETRREREMYDLDSAFRHLNRLFHLAVDRSEWNQIRENQKVWNPSALYPRIQKLENEVFKNPKALNPIDDSLLSHALNFYRLAYSREDALVQNSLSQMKASKVSKAVLITGGFHSDGIHKKLKSANFSYLSVRPSVIESGEESRYLEIMLGRRNILPDFYFNQPKKNSLAVPAQLPKPGRLIVRTLLDSGSAIPGSQAFRDGLESNLNRLVEKGVFDGVFAENPVSAEMGGTSQNLEIFLRSSNQEVKITVPSDASQKSFVTANSLGNRKKVAKPEKPTIEKVAIWDFRNDGGKTTAVVLASRGIHVDIFDLEKNIKRTESVNHEGTRQQDYDNLKSSGLITTNPIDIISADDKEKLEQVLGPSAVVEEAEKRKTSPEWIERKQVEVVKNYPVIFVDPGIFLEAKNRSEFDSIIRKRSAGFGQALKVLRSKGNTEKRVFVVRSQIPARLTDEIMRIIFEESGYDTNFSVVHVPDNFRSGHQIEDMRKQKALLGFPELEAIVPKKIRGNEKQKALAGLSETQEWAQKAVLSVLKGNRYQPEEFFVMDSRSAEMAPFSTQLFLFTKLLTAMAFTQLVHALGGDIEKVVRGAGLDARIGLDYMKVSFGVGGMLRRFLNLATDENGNGSERSFPQLWYEFVKTLKKEHENQIEWFKNIIETVLKSKFRFHELANKEYAIWGIASKADNGSLSGSPALDLVKWLIQHQARKIYISDPHVDEKEFWKWFEEQKNNASGEDRLAFQRAEELKVIDFSYLKDPLAATQNADVTIIAADHKKFKEIKPEEIAKAVSDQESPLFQDSAAAAPIFDGRNIFELGPIRKARINYISIGRTPIGPNFKPTKDRDAIENAAFDKNAGPKNALVLGSKYVGLTTGTAMSDTGNNVTIADVDVKRIDHLNDELKRARRERIKDDIDVGIYEPGLPELIIKNAKKNRLQFVKSHTDKQADQFKVGDLVTDALIKSDVIYIAVGTPQGDDGNANLDYVMSATRTIGHVLKNVMPTAENKGPKRKVIVVKSTVPPRTFDEMKHILESEFGLKEEVDFDIASNPEFLQEGKAVKDVFEPHRTVLGTESEFATKILRELWWPLEKRHSHEVLVTDRVSASLIKYLSNVFLAISISFANAQAWLAEQVGASYQKVVSSIKTHQYVAQASFLGAGIGYGGSCFPKDVSAAIYEFSHAVAKIFQTAVTAVSINEQAPKKVFEKIVATLGDASGRKDKPLQGKKITLYGSAFKNKTDDVRESPTLPLLLMLEEAGAKVVVIDPLPKAQENFRKLFADETAGKNFGDRIQILDGPAYRDDRDDAKVLPALIQAAEGADMVAIVNDWPIYKKIDFRRLTSVMLSKQQASQPPSRQIQYPVLYDIRNLLRNRIEDIVGNGLMLLGTGEKPVVPITSKGTDSAIGLISELEADGASLGSSAPIKVAVLDRLNLKESNPANVQILNVAQLSPDQRIDAVTKFAPNVLVVRAFKVDKDLMALLPSLKLVIRAGHGTDNIDSVFAGTRGIKVLRTGGSEHAVAALTMRMLARAAQIHSGKKEVSSETDHASSELFFTIPDWRTAITKKIATEITNKKIESSQAPALEQKAQALFQPLDEETLASLKGKTIGIIGYGGIGKRIAEIAEALGMKVLINSRSLEKDPSLLDPKSNFEIVSKDEILKRSAFVTLSTGLTSDTKGFVNDAAVDLMISNPDFIALINADREGLVPAASAEKLIRNGKMYLGDFIPANPFLREDMLFTPHVGASTDRGEQHVVAKTAQVLDSEIQKLIQTNNPAAGASLGYSASESARALVRQWVDAQMIDAGRQFANSLGVQPADISPDARVAAGRIFASVKNNLPGELVIPVEAQSDESLLKILEPIALQLRGESKKDVSIFTTSALKSKIESALKSLKVDSATLHDYVHFKSPHESLELYLIGRTAKFGEGRVVLIGDSGKLANVAVPGVRKISRDQVRSGQATQNIQQKDRLVAQVAAIDLGLDLLSASEWIPQPDKLQQDGNMLFMKEDFFTQYAEKWIAQMHAQMAILIAA